MKRMNEVLTDWILLTVKHWPVNDFELCPFVRLSVLILLNFVDHFVTWSHNIIRKKKEMATRKMITNNLTVSDFFRFYSKLVTVEAEFVSE